MTKLQSKALFPSYDEQEFVSFDQNFSSLYFEVRAVEQQDTSGFGPMYLLNGLTNNGYWYQVGISYHRPFGINNQSYYFNGWVFTCEVWNYAGYSIFQVTGGSPTVRMNIRNGDWVDLDLYFLLNGSIDMKVVDPSTGASEAIPYPSFGASFFTGTEKVTSKAGYWTGLMTECYHALQCYN